MGLGNSGTAGAQVKRGRDYQGGECTKINEGITQEARKKKTENLPILTGTEGEPKNTG